jgi:hypothetical protein
MGLFPPQRSDNCRRSEAQPASPVSSPLLVAGAAAAGTAAGCRGDACLLLPYQKHYHHSVPFLPGYISDVQNLFLVRVSVVSRKSFISATQIGWERIDTLWIQCCGFNLDAALAKVIRREFWKLSLPLLYVYCIARFVSHKQKKS